MGLETLSHLLKIGGMIHKTKLENGLTILLKPMHHAPVASMALFYRVGSRHERAGATGLAHWVEHMMFKGTPTYPAGYWDKRLAREGADWNAYTWIDYTCYYVTLPASQIHLALQMETDRMSNLSMEPDEVEAERQVILAERAMYENDPTFLLEEELTAVAFRTHPYHHDVLGEMVDIQNLPRQTLLNFYRDYYAPANGVLVIAGQFEPAPLLAEIERTFGQIPRGQETPAIWRQEPEQRGERRVMIQGPEETAYLYVIFRAPAVTHADFFPLALLNMVLAGGSSLGSLGSGGSNKSTRLYKALVDAELAVAVRGSLEPTIDPYLYQIQVVGNGERPLADIETALYATLDQLKEEPITADELTKAKKQAKVSYAFAQERMSGQAQALGIAEMITGDYRWYETVPAQIEAVTIDDMMRVCEQYLHSQNRIVGWYDPQ